jgi:hypothetical protein
MSEEEEIFPGITTGTTSNHYNFSGLIKVRN